MIPKKTIPNKTHIYHFDCGSDFVVAFFEPPDGHSPILKYEVAYGEVGVSLEQVEVVSRMASLLKPKRDKVYIAKVRAVNEIGPGPWSEIVPCSKGQDAGQGNDTQDDTLPATLSFHDVQLGLEGLGTTVPYGQHPMNVPGGQWPEITQKEWRDMNWNPPWNMPWVQDSDPAADKKPKWKALVRGCEDNELAIMKTEALINLRENVRSMITRAYGKDYTEDEIFMRLRGDDTPAMKETVRHLRKKYQKMKVDIDKMDKSAIMSLDISSDIAWGVVYDSEKGHLVEDK